MKSRQDAAFFIQVVQLHPGRNACRLYITHLPRNQNADNSKIENPTRKASARAMLLVLRFPSAPSFIMKKSGAQVGQNGDKCQNKIRHAAVIIGL